MWEAPGFIPQRVHVCAAHAVSAAAANLDRGNHGDSNPRLLHVKRLSDLQALRQFSVARRQRGFELQLWEPQGFEPRPPACENGGPIFKPCANFLRHGAGEGSSCGRRHKVCMPRMEFGPQAWDAYMVPIQYMCRGQHMEHTLLEYAPLWLWKVDTLGFEPRAFRMRSGCDTTTPCAPCCMR